MSEFTTPLGESREIASGHGPEPEHPQHGGDRARGSRQDDLDGRATGTCGGHLAGAGGGQEGHRHAQG